MSATNLELPQRRESKLRAFFRPAKQRWPAWKFLNIVSAVVLGWVLVLSTIQSTWHFGVAPLIKCLPEDYFLIGQQKPDTLERGNAYRFIAHGLGPVIPERMPLVKRAAALEGDVVSVNAGGVSVNGKFWGPLNAQVMKKAGLTVATVTRTYTVPKGRVLMLGTLPRSFDGRYFGPVETKTITGRAIPLW